LIVQLRVFAAFLVLLFAVAPGHAQAPPPPGVPPPPASLPPVPGFVPPYEIMRTVRAAGLDPLSPPLREGTTYVLRATDFRGILMRVVIDARTGAIRDATRIVPGAGPYGPGAYGSGAYGRALYGPGGYGLGPYGYGPGAYGRVGMMPPYNGPPGRMPPPYGRPPPDFDESDALPDETGALPPAAPITNPVTRATVTIFPPLPRPRPAELAAKPSDEAKPQIVPVDAPGGPAAAKTDTKPTVAADSKPEAKTDITATVPAPSSPQPAPPSAPAPTKTSKAPTSLMISN
jgi:hypothetical protein